MKDRVTEAELQSIVDRINRITNSPMSPYLGGAAQIGNYHLSHAYGGVTMHRMSNLGGGISDPIRSGYMPKRELRERLYAFISGIYAQREANQPAQA